LYLRARHAFRRGWRENTMEAIALFEQALALAPDDPTILAGYARAQFRRFLFDTEASGALEAEEKGRAAAERALVLAPRLGEAHAALSNVKWMMGDYPGSARDLREALRIAPSSPDVAELYGRMLLEAGQPERAVAILGAAAALDPAVDFSSGDLLRARAFVGDWSAYEAAVERAPADDTHTNLHFFLMARLAAWRRDRAGAAALRPQVEARAFPLRGEVLGLLAVVETGAIPEGMEAAVLEWGRVVGRAKRRPMFLRQIAAEMFAFVGRNDGAIRMAAESDALGLIDVTWMDRCPLLAPLRGIPAFVAVRDRVAERARAALDVLEGRVE
ncbi:MAG TPA: tetratricopeptide repeat protein, partial [Polyangiaceae bacterium]|nr:tetratricopeptide repeat protein [Polyangiaceae bacterium]